jgi:hypothetical protein
MTRMIQEKEMVVQALAKMSFVSILMINMIKNFSKTCIKWWKLSKLSLTPSSVKSTSR